MSQEHPKRVTKIRIEVTTFDGIRREAVFVRREKVDDLMSDSGSLGEFLRDLVATAGPGAS